MTSESATIIAALIQAGLGAAAWRLANKIGARLDTTDKRVDGIDTRVGVLERQKA